ncbi:MAG: ATP-binding protein [Aquincola tertiaricarbonis]
MADTLTVTPPPPAAAYCFGPFRLLPHQRLLERDGAPLRVGARAFDLLLALVRQAGQVLSKDALMAMVWPDSVVDEGNLRVHLVALRKVLGDGKGQGRYIDHVPMRGYCFVAAVQALQAAAAPAPAPAVAGGAPADLPAAPVLIGREADIAALQARLRQQRFVSLVGPGGAGKTSLARAAAQALAADCADGVFFVDLAALAHPALVPAATAAALGLPAVQADPLPSLLAWLHARRALLLLDNCEHVIDAAAALAEQVAQGAPGVLLLATSREPLRARGEAVQRLGPLPLPPPDAELTAEQYLAHPAVQLFVERASASGETGLHTVERLATVAALCRRMDGLPLAIELAASRAATFGLTGLLGDLDRFLLLRSGGRRTAPPRHKTLHAALEWSHQTLSADEQQALRALSVFPSAFTLEDASAVLRPWPRLRPLPLLSSLALKSLLQADVGGAHVAYRLLETTRAYAREQLLQAGESAAVQRQHALHMAARLQAGAMDGTALEPGVRAALEWALSAEGDAALALQLAADAAGPWFQRSLLGEYRLIAERALALLPGLPQAPPPLEMRLQAAYAQALVHAAGPGSPLLVAACRRALALAGQLGDAACGRQMLFRLWNASVVNGEYETALEWALQFSSATAASDDPQDELLRHRMMLLSLHTLGEHQRAHAHGQAILQHPGVAGRSLQRRAFEVDHRVIALAFNARALWMMGRPDAAWAAARESVEESLSAGQLLGQMYALGVSACLVALWNGDLPAADDCVAMLAERAASQSLTIWSLWARCFDAALVLRGHSPAPRPAAPAADALPYNAMQQEVLATLVEGMASPQAVQRALAERHRVWCAPEVLRSQAVALLGQAAQPAQAQALLRQSAAIAKAQGALAWQLRTATTLARQAALHQGPGAARAVLEPVVERFAEGWATHDLRTATGLLSAWSSAA